MAFRIRKFFELSTLLVSWLLVSVAGCSRSGPEAALPPEQAAAFKALEDFNAKVLVRDGEVVYVDFYGMPDTTRAIAHLKTFPHVEKLNFSSTSVTDEELVHLANLTDLKELASL